MNRNQVEKVERVETIGNKIYHLRKENGFTQEALARAVYVTDGTISKWENGYSQPDYGYLKSLAKVFKVNPSYFLDDRSPKGRFRSFYREVFSFIGKHWRKTLLVILFIFLIFYFFNTFDKLAMYEIVSTDETLTFETGYMARSKTTLIITINNINYKTDEDDIISQKIKLYYLNNEDKKYFYESSEIDDISYREAIGYDIPKKYVKHLDNNLYLEIENLHEDNSITTYETKLSFKLYISSSRLFYTEKLTYDEETETKNDGITNVVTEYNLIHNGYKQIEGTQFYFKNFKNYSLYFDLNNNRMFYTIESDKERINYNYYFNNDYITYSKIVNKEIVEKCYYDNVNNIIIFLEGECPNYIDKYNDIKDKFDKAFS